jgi:hypothetical protein
MVAWVESLLAAPLRASRSEGSRLSGQLAPWYGKEAEKEEVQGILLILKMLVSELSEVVGGSFAQGGEGLGGHLRVGETLVTTVKLER